VASELTFILNSARLLPAASKGWPQPVNDLAALLLPALVLLRVLESPSSTRRTAGQHIDSRLISCAAAR